ncbi:MAG: alpha/beta hydrolase [Sulfurovum sp.]|uniref:alpha/beta hydrolase n=1 Tax=Sulfurovum sp. TaxID=1969726 RepID=UPI002867FB34|nr:alpha/beta hydrolase [Sulfurovum sp.]MCO4845205.1 alpha/beta hydrolase [Sulfurovum sp.]
MNKVLKKISILLLIGYVGTGVFLYLNQRSFLYFPTPNISTPYTQMTLQNERESIHIIVLNKGHKNAILYFGGNAESMAQSSAEIARQFPAFTVYLMDYRGYGSSTGEASEEGLYSDALKLYDTIKPKHDRIAIGGRSLGSGIATYVAAHREVSKLALITPFDSIINVAQAMYPIFPISFLLHDAYDSLSRIKDIKAKTLIVIAQNDNVITRERTQELIDAFDTGKLQVMTIKNRGHNDISSDARYYKIMQDFIGDG